MKIKAILEVGKKFIVKNAPTILVGFGIAGSAASVIFAIKDTPKAQKAIAELKEKKEDPNILDKAKTLAPIYWKTILLWCMSSGCVIFSNHINLKRLSTMIALYKMAEGNKEKLEEAMRKVLGDTKTEEVFDATRKDLFKNSPDEDYKETGKGTQKFMDGFSRQKFRSSVQAVGEAFNRFNHRLLADDTACINELMDELDIDSIDPRYILGYPIGGSDFGDRIGWRAEDGLVEYKITWVPGPDGDPIGVIGYELPENPFIFNY